MLTAITDAISHFELDPAQVVIAGHCSGDDRLPDRNLHADQLTGVLVP